MKHVALISLSPEFAELFKDAVRSSTGCSFEAVVFKSIEDAVMYFKHHHCDIALLDARDAPWIAHEMTEKIMHESALPILLCSRDGSTDGLMDALDAGAISAVRVPERHASDEQRHSFCRTIQLVSEIKVVQRRQADRPLACVGHTTTQANYVESGISLVAIGASAGGTTALQTVLTRLRSPFAVPIVVVQHISHGHIHGLSRWLNEQSQLDVTVAENGVRLRPGTVYLAPDDRHLLIDSSGRIQLDDGEAIQGLRPAIGRLFESVLQVFGAGSIAVLLSGMGNDGASAMRALYEAGAMTIAQDKASSLIHGIPGEAIRLSAARLVLALDEIGPAVNAFVDKYAHDEAFVRRSLEVRR